MPTFIYLFDDLTLFVKRKKFKFLKESVKQCPILMENKKSEFKCDVIIKFTEYISKMVSVEEKVEMLTIEDGLNVIFNESGIGMIESYFQLTNDNVKDIYQTLNNYKKGSSLIFLLE